MKIMNVLMFVLFVSIALAGCAEISGDARYVVENGGMSEVTDIKITCGEHEIQLAVLKAGATWKKRMKVTGTCSTTVEYTDSSGTHQMHELGNYVEKYMGLKIHIIVGPEFSWTEHSSGERFIPPPVHQEEGP